MPKFMLILRSDITAASSTLTPEDFGEILAYQAWGKRMGDRLIACQNGHSPPPW